MIFSVEPGSYFSVYFSDEAYFRQNMERLTGAQR